MKILITGCAGFIGFHLSKYLLSKNNIKVFGIDNLNNYYDLKLKKNRLSILEKNKKFFFNKLDITNKKKLLTFCSKKKIKVIVHLAAQAGVRYSIQDPESYVRNNIIGFFNILECSRYNKIDHLLFASTSSIYGNNNDFPLKENLKTDEPLSFYASTKKSNEVMAYSFSNIYNLPCTALRFFTVYGPYGRPDMSLFKFTDSILKNRKIDLYNKGDHYRDFTYIDDVVISIFKLLKKRPNNKVPYDVFNIGSGNPKHLKVFLKLIEKNLNKKAKINYLPMQLGDVHKTHANCQKLNKKIKYKPKIDIKIGIKKFVNWYKNYYLID